MAEVGVWAEQVVELWARAREERKEQKPLRSSSEPDPRRQHYWRGKES